MTGGGGEQAIKESVIAESVIGAMHRVHFLVNGIDLLQPLCRRVEGRLKRPLSLVGAFQEYSLPNHPSRENPAHDQDYDGY